MKKHHQHQPLVKKMKKKERVVKISKVCQRTITARIIILLVVRFFIDSPKVFTFLFSHYLQLQTHISKSIIPRFSEVFQSNLFTENMVANRLFCTGRNWRQIHKIIFTLLVHWTFIMVPSLGQLDTPCCILLRRHGYPSSWICEYWVLKTLSETWWSSGGHAVEGLFSKIL